MVKVSLAALAILFTFSTVRAETADTFVSSSVFTDGSSKCPYAPTLYRGIRSDSVNMLQMVRNMLGDPLAELRSWGMSRVLKEKSAQESMTESQWLKYKMEALSRLLASVDRKESVCGDLAEKSAAGTTLDKTAEEKLQAGAFGIATTPSFTEARKYALVSHAGGERPGEWNSIIVRIEEKTPRAAAVRGLLDTYEYYIPLVIPAGDITGAWSKNLHLAKVDRDSEKMRIDVYSVPDGGLPFFPDTSRGRFKLIGKIIRCKSNASCKSDRPPKGAPKELLDIISGIGGNYPYHFVTN